MEIWDVISTAWGLYKDYQANQEREELLSEIRALRRELEALKGRASPSERAQINELDKKLGAIDQGEAEGDEGDWWDWLWGDGEEAAGQPVQAEEAEDEGDWFWGGEDSGTTDETTSDEPEDGWW